MSSVLENAVQNPGTLYLMGIVALILGVVMTASRAAWSGWQLLVALIGWLALAKGTVIILFPESIASLYRRMNKPGVFAVGGIVIVVIGLFFMWIGFGW